MSNEKDMVSSPVTKEEQADLDKVDVLFEGAGDEVDKSFPNQEPKPVKKAEDHFIVTADWHVGLTRYSRDNKKGVPERHKELLESIGYIFKYAYDTKASFVVIAGDLFDNNHPSQLYYGDLIPIFKQISEWKIPVFILSGNHDAINTIPQMNALRTIFKSKFDNIEVINEIEFHSGVLPGYDFLFIPHVNRCEYSVFNPEAERGLISEKLQYLKLNPKRKNLVFGHALVPGSIQGAERLVMRGGEQTFDLEINAEAYFFGHMHTPQEMKWKGKPLYYPGSIQAIDMGEREDEKGFIDASITKDGIKIKRLSIPTRKLVQINIDSYDDYLAQFETEGVSLSSAYGDLKDKIVKVKIKVPTTQKSQINESKIKKFCKKAYWLDIAYDLQRETATRNENVTIEADPDKALSGWYESRKYPKEDFAEISKRHNEIMAEVTALKE